MKVQLPAKLSFLLEAHTFKVAYGGRIGAKSHSFAAALLGFGVKSKERILCCREIQKSIKASVHKLLADKIQQMGLEGFYEVLDTTIKGKNGTEFLFEGLANHTVTSIKSIEGITKCWAEEAQTISQRSWDILRPTIIRNEGAEIWISFNPDLDTDPTYVDFVLKPPKSAKVVNINYYDNPWYSPSAEEERREFKEKRSKEDYDNIWLGVPHKAAGGSYFGLKVLGRHVNTVGGSKGFILNNEGIYSLMEAENGAVEIWTPPYYEQPDFDSLEWVDRYTIGSDVSEGLGATSSTAYVFDRVEDEFVAKMSSNVIDAYAWANMLYDLAMYYNNAGMNALACVEKTGAGQTTVKRLRDLRAKQYTVIKPDQTTGKPTKSYGFNQTSNNKHVLSGELKRYLGETEGHVKCATLISECTTYILHDDGHLGHTDGTKDDHVIGAGLALQACNMMTQPARQVRVAAHMAKIREAEIAELGGGLSSIEARHQDEVAKKYAEGGDEEWT